MSGANSVPSFDFWLDQFAVSDSGDGWLMACKGAGRCWRLCRELVEPLATLLHGLAGGRPVLEVCSGGGELAAALRAAGVPILATDACASPGSNIERLAAQERF